MGTRRTTQYVIEKPWQRSPEVLKGTAKWIVMAFVAGIIFCLFVTGGDRAKRIEDKTAKYKAEIQTSQTCAPKKDRK